MRGGAIVGSSPLHTTFGVMNVERRSLLTRVRLAGMHFVEVRSTLTAWQPAMRRNLCFGSTVCITIRAGRGSHTA